jgi:magnesium chelatase subunit D
LDRFGLSIAVRGLEVQATRIEAIRQRLHFDDRPAEMAAAAEPAEEDIRHRIERARARLTALPITENHLASVAALAAAARVDGIRGDLALIKSARALAAWEEASSIGENHIERVAELALTHRSRPRKPPQKPRSPTTSRSLEADPTPPSTNASHDSHERSAREDAKTKPVEPSAESAARFATDVVDRTRAGRRGADSLLGQRATRVIPFEAGTLAVAPTLNAAARRGARMEAEGVPLLASDLMQHERRGPGRCEVLFLVDASGSMGTQRRLEAAKSAALGLLTSSYQRRDEVALMVFRGDSSDLVLPFTRQVARIEEALREVPSGGRTPLARALLDAADVLRTRESSLLVLFTDGRANVASEGQDPWEQALEASATVRAACSAALVIDCEAGPIFLGRARSLAKSLGADYVGLDELEGSALTLRIHRRLETL